MSGPAFDALSQKRKKIATELAELETKVRNIARGISALHMSVIVGAPLHTNSVNLFSFTQIYDLETEYCGMADYTSFGTVLKVSRNYPSL